MIPLRSPRYGSYADTTIRSPQSTRILVLFSRRGHIRAHAYVQHVLSADEQLCAAFQVRCILITFSDTRWLAMAPCGVGYLCPEWLGIATIAPRI